MRIAKFIAASTMGAALLIAGAAQAATITLSLGNSAETFTQYGQGADGTGLGTFREGQGASSFDGVTSTFVLSGAILGGNTAGLDSGTYQFVTTYAGPDSPNGGPNAPRGRTNANNALIFNYYYLDPSTRMNLFLNTPTGQFVYNLYNGVTFNGGFGFTIQSPVCTGLVGPCTQNAVGLTPGSTISGPVRIGVSFDSGGLSAVPEPATWAMMVGGFMAIGAMVRRRRRMALGAA